MASHMRISALLAAACLLDASRATYPWQDPALPTQQRIDNLLSLLSVDEKVSLLSTDNPPIARIQLPGFTFARECERGDTSGSLGTAFPSGVAMASSFDAGMVWAVAQATAVEARANIDLESPGGIGGGVCFAPVVNFIHDARWGRVNEMLTGEDTTLGGVLGAAFTDGMQHGWEAGTGYRAIAAVVKHANAYSGPEGTGYTFGPLAKRFSYNVHLPERAWREFFVPVYRDVMAQGVAGAMCSYSSMTFDDSDPHAHLANNTPACASSLLLRDTLREEFGWRGFVLSDAGAVAFIGNVSIGGDWFGHGYAKDNAGAAIASLTGGNNLELTCCGAPAVYPTLSASIANGLLPESAVDAALNDTLRARFELGALDPVGLSPYSHLTAANVSTPDMISLALQAAREGVVLLKNEGGALPFSRDALAGRTIAVVGPNANSSWAQMGGYVNQRPRFISTALAGVTDAFPLSIVSLAEGCNETACEAFDAAGIAAAAASADVTVAVLGTTQYFHKGWSNESAACGCPAGNAIEGECCDRTDVALPGQQLALLQTAVAAAAGKPVVVVLVSSGLVDIAWAQAAPGVSAIVHLPFLGMTGGIALGQALAGDFSPAGRLTTSWYRNISDVGELGDYSYGSLYNRTYRYTTAPLLYPFGFGLSYGGPFLYSGLAAPAAVDPCATVSVNVTVRNTGSVDSDEVVQAYVTVHNATVRVPIRQLVAFARVRVPAGGAVEVPLTFAPERHAVLRNPDLVTVIEPGPRTIWVGGASDPAAAPGVAGSFAVVGAATPLSSCARQGRSSRR